MVNPKIITIDKEILGGTPVFKNTRVPVKNLLDYLKSGYSIAVFLDHFPSVKKEIACQFLEISFKEYLVNHNYENIA